LIEACCHPDAILPRSDYADQNAWAASVKDSASKASWTLLNLTVFSG
jgi:hypothetical protein